MEGTLGREKIEVRNSMIVEAQIIGQNTLASFLGDSSFHPFSFTLMCIISFPPCLYLIKILIAILDNWASQGRQVLYENCVTKVK